MFFSLPLHIPANLCFIQYQLTEDDLRRKSRKEYCWKMERKEKAKSTHFSFISSVTHWEVIQQISRPTDLCCKNCFLWPYSWEHFMLNVMLLTAFLKIAEFELRAFTLPSVQHFNLRTINLTWLSQPLTQGQRERPLASRKVLLSFALGSPFSEEEKVRWLKGREGGSTRTKGRRPKAHISNRGKNKRQRRESLKAGFPLNPKPWLGDWMLT